MKLDEPDKMIGPFHRPFLSVIHFQIFANDDALCCIE